MPFYKTDDFKKLNNAWKKKLKQSGFSDIEYDENHLLSFASEPFMERPFWDQSKAEYYRFAGQFFHDHSFASVFDKFVWEKHAEGLSIREIILLAKKTKFDRKDKPKFSINSHNVHVIIKKHRDLMKAAYNILGTND